MADQIPPLRLVRTSDPVPPVRPRRPGVAVVLILLYAGIFGAGLWWIRTASPLFKARSRRPDPGAGGAPTPVPRSVAASEPGGAPGLDAGARERLARRAALLAGEGLSAAHRAEYIKRIEKEPCTCGCELTVQSCLARDRFCSRSPEIAEKIRKTFR